MWYFLPLIVLFPLALLTRAKRGMLLMLPLVLIGTLWFGRYFLPKATAQPEEGGLSVITFNVWGGNPQLASVEAWLREQNADVVLLQEVPPSWLSGGLVALRDAYPYQFGETTELGWWGSVILSKHPAASEQEFAVTAEGIPFYQYLRLDINGETIGVYNLHVPMPIGDDPHFAFDTQNGFLNMVLKYDPEPRNVGIRWLLAALENETNSFIVGGDFNMSDQAAFMTILRRVWEIVSARLVMVLAQAGPSPRSPDSLRLCRRWYGSITCGTAVSFKPSAQYRVRI